MTGRRIVSGSSFAFIGVTMAACVASDVGQEVPDTVIQHTLSALTREQTFTWQDEIGRSFMIRPLGTFQSGEAYCRDYEVSTDDLGGKPKRRTACRYNDRWVPVDPSEV